MREWNPQYSWDSRERHRDKVLAREREYKRRNGWAKVRDPIKEKARHAVRNAVAAGRIIKPSSCPSCGRVVSIHAHHHDYSKPLEFVWLCSLCHGKEHRKARAALREDR